LDNIGSLPFISWGDFIETQVIIFSCPFTDVPSFVEKYKKIKYAISDWRQLDLCETSFFITEWIALKLKILTDIKIRFKKNLTFA
jgi:predicted phage-related endonuclease